MKIDEIIDIQEYKSVIYLNGNFKCDFLKPLNLPIIAADGAANKIIAEGIEPYVIIGDMDSINKELLRDRHHITIADQDTCDFEKAMNYAEKNNMLPAIITGFNGECIDHTLNNISIFSNSQSVLFSDQIIGFTVITSKKLLLPDNTKISILGMPYCRINTHGLKWELENEELTICGKSSYFNRSTSESVSITIQEGKALVFIYLYEIIDNGSS